MGERQDSRSGLPYGTPCPRRCLARGRWLAVLLMAGCSQSSSATDAGVDAEVIDAHRFDGTTDGFPEDGRVDADAGGRPFPLPLYRIGPRSSFGAGYGPYDVSGRVRLPSDTLGFASFEGWTLETRSPGLGTGAVTIGPAQREGDYWVAELSAHVTFATEVPRESRELCTLSAPSGELRLLGVVGEDGQLLFDVESTARQLLKLNGVSDNDEPFESAYYFGSREGDDSAIEAAIPAVVDALGEALRERGMTDISPSGFVRAGSALFAVVDGRVGSEAPPSVVAPRSPSHIGRISGVRDRVFSLWINDYPSPHIWAENQDTVGFFLYTQSVEPDALLYARAKRRDGNGRSSASDYFSIAGEPGVGPAALTLSLDAEGATACGADTGNYVVFFSSGTELATGFAASLVGSEGCVSLSRTMIPPGVGLLTAAQVDGDLQVGTPSEAVFP